MTTRRIGAAWFDAAQPFNDFINAPHGYYSVDGGADVDMGELTTTTYQSEPDPISGGTVTLYQGSVNPTVPAGALGSNVVFKIYDPVNENDKLEYDAIDVCSADAVSAVVSPSNASVRVNNTLQFSVVFYAADDLPTDTHDPATWITSASGAAQGSIDNSTGVFTAGTDPGGPYTVTMAAGAVTDDAAVTVVPETSRRADGLNISLGVML